MPMFVLFHLPKSSIKSSTLSLTNSLDWLTEPEAVGVPGWQTGAKALCLYSQFPQACKPICRALTWLTTALVEWNALHTILALGAWQT